MPIRIKPVHDFKPCVLVFEDLENIIIRVEKDFSDVKYFASDGSWEVYDEPRTSFLSAIAQRETLDSFKVQAVIDSQQLGREIEITFNQKEAKLICTAKVDELDWFEHFLIDLKKHIRPPTFTQLMVHVLYGQGGFDIRFMFLAAQVKPSEIAATPYCKIVIRQKPPSPFIENIKANIVSNIIWAVVVFALGSIATLITQWFLNR